MESMNIMGPVPLQNFLKYTHEKPHVHNPPFKQGYYMSDGGAGHSVFKWVLREYIIKRSPSKAVDRVLDGAQDGHFL